MTMREVVQQYLRAQGYDGLYNDDVGCACLPDDLAPCESDCLDCKPGYRHAGDCEFDFYIRAWKE